MNSQLFPRRKAPIEISADDFRLLGHQLVDRLADWMDDIPSRPVTQGKSPAEIRELLGNKSLPEKSNSLFGLLPETTEMIHDHSLYNGHLRFLGYITSSPRRLVHSPKCLRLVSTLMSVLGTYHQSPARSKPKQSAGSMN